MNDKADILLKTFNKVLHSSYTDLEVTRSKVPEWDSMKHAELIIELQKVFKIKFKIEDILELENLSDFLALI